MARTTTLTEDVALILQARLPGVARHARLLTRLWCAFWVLVTVVLIIGLGRSIPKSIFMLFAGWAFAVMPSGLAGKILKEKERQAKRAKEPKKRLRRVAKVGWPIYAIPILGLVSYGTYAGYDRSQTILGALLQIAAVWFLLQFIPMFLILLVGFEDVKSDQPNEAAAPAPAPVVEDDAAAWERLEALRRCDNLRFKSRARIWFAFHVFPAQPGSRIDRLWRWGDERKAAGRVGLVVGSVYNVPRNILFNSGHWLLVKAPGWIRKKLSDGIAKSFFEALIKS